MELQRPKTVSYVNNIWPWKIPRRRTPGNARVGESLKTENLSPNDFLDHVSLRVMSEITSKVLQEYLSCLQFLCTEGAGWQTRVD